MDIVIDKLSKSYGDKKVLHNFSARIKEGSIASVMAPSGAGKTTLLRILAGLESADSGSIQGMENKKISMVFQEDRLCENLSSLLNIRMVCSKEISDSRILEELKEVGLEGSEMQPVRELSGGMKRRVALVRAVLASCDILILDEPFKGLDEDNKIQAMNYMLKKHMEKTVILVTHDENEARFMGGEIINLI